MLSTHAPRMFPFLEGHLPLQRVTLRGKGGTVFRLRACLLPCNAQKNFTQLVFALCSSTSFEFASRDKQFCLFQLKLNKYVKNTKSVPKNTTSWTPAQTP